MSLRSSAASICDQALAVARRPMFREGAVEAIPMAIGIAAWGLVAGVAMAKRWLEGCASCRERGPP